MIHHLVTNPCRDACGTEETDAVFEGSPVYRCPGCESTWAEVPVQGVQATPLGADHAGEQAN
ncbi:MAG: hypothetical protein J0I14_01655 [Propionibacteriaceae bacterium]|jgi:predicted Zn-ribbon and HTH transcriptional regulator|nr:hypothetical protein [Propionibacteriaceae bacterium]